MVRPLFPIDDTPMIILLVEDSAGDIRLTLEAFGDANSSARLYAVEDGTEAMAFLRRQGENATAPRPELILLDLNLPKMDGREVLELIKNDENLKLIPTVILTTSAAEEDFVDSYRHQANCYLRKPVDMDAFADMVKNINEFWIAKARLPQLAFGGHPLLPRSPCKPLLQDADAMGQTDILLVEDSPGDVRLTLEAFRDADPKICLHVANDGMEAMAFLKRERMYAKAPRPDLILLDLNMPKMDGREVLALIKNDESLKLIPIVILTTSGAEEDILKSYQLQANSYLRKPVEFDGFEDLVKSIRDYWLTTVSLPQFGIAI